MNKTPIPVKDQFTDEQKEKVKELWYAKKTQKEIANFFNVPRRTIMKLCKHLKLSRTTAEAAYIKNKSPLDTPEIVKKIKKLRNTASLQEIAKLFNSSTSAVARLCEKYDIKFDKEDYKELQTERIKNAWTQEKIDAISGSQKYPQLNDKKWLYDQYITQEKPVNVIHQESNIPLSTLTHHLKRHNIKLRPKEQYLKNLRRKMALKEKINSKWGSFTVQSKAEAQFIKFLENSNAVSVEYEPQALKYNKLQYTPDFKVDGQFVEIKPPEYAKESGINRQRFVKQILIAQKNNIDIKCWYKKGYYTYEPISDIDKYFCLNWKLIFNNSDECFKFLTKTGFIPLKWEKDKLLFALNNMFKAKGDDQLNANYQNAKVVDFMRHFNDHYWSSTHKHYNTIKMAFEPGNRVVLRSAVDTLWEKKSNVNIYNLVRLINRHYKDFMLVSMFKPWVAKYVYDKLLPDGGIVIDPCIGWGGRFLGTLDSNIEYIGFDLNPLAVESIKEMREFIGSRVEFEPEFSVADASTKVWPKGDLLFTSPPYDDTEFYHGLEAQCNDTTPIYENIFTFDGIVALNVPLRHQDKCVKIAKEYGYMLQDAYKMRTNNFIARTTSYEPILIFKREGSRG